jgi:hypothetical protein
MVAVFSTFMTADRNKLNAIVHKNDTAPGGNSRYRALSRLALAAMLLQACTTRQPSADVVDASDMGAAADASPEHDVPSRPLDVRLPDNDVIFAEPGPYQPHAPRLRRLTKRQYTNSVHDIVGEWVVVPRALEPDTVSEGSSSVGASESSISQRGTEQYESAAFDIAEQALRNPARRASVVLCTPNAVQDPACAANFVQSMGRKLWRRPLTMAETTRLVSIANNGAMVLNDFYRGLEYAFAALLQAPDFLFRVELGTPRAAPVMDRRYERYELASRLAFFLWDGPPDDALLSAAESGPAIEGAALSAQVTRMLQSPKARRGFEAFVIDWLRLDELDGLSRDARLFPSFAADFGPSAREEVLRTALMFAFDRDSDFRELLTTRETWVNRRLASVYGVAFPTRDAPPTAFERVEFSPTQPRRGLLGMAAFLLLQAHPTNTSPTLRGKFVRELLLCEAMPAPPVGVNTAIPEPSMQARTLRERLMMHQQVPSCRGCHIQMDNIGLGFENFDALGRYRRQDNGVEIDPAGTFDGIPYADPVDLATVLRGHYEFPRCLASRVYRHAWGAHDQEPQRAELERLVTAFASSGYRFQALLSAVANGEAFRRGAGFTPDPLPPENQDAGAGRDSASTDATDAEAGADR